MTCILGIDPGLASTGWGVVTVEGSRNRHIAHGTITTPAGEALATRLVSIYRSIVEVVERYQPAEAGIEMLYFARNATSALPVAHARGVIMVALAQQGIVCSEYPPQEIKQSIVGNGRATKDQVQQMIRLLLGLPEIPKPDHSADALAAAVCHVSHRLLQDGRHVQ
jgi:crossover junction endodeoxyribonuclease RuvC